MTIKEIAQICGVSRGTVDRVLNKRGRVKPQTEALIMHTIEHMGYTKNIVGRALTVKRTAPVIGVILCSEGNEFFDDVIAGFQKAQAELADYGVSLVLRTMRGHVVEWQLHLIDEIADGLSALVIQPINDPRVEARLCKLKAEGIPTVAVNTDIARSCRCCYVGSDYVTGGETAAGLMHLVTNGQAKLGIITGVNTLMGHMLRLNGFEAHLKKHSPYIQVVARDSAQDDHEQAYRATAGMLASHPEIDALLVVAAGACDVCRAVVDMKREDIRVVSYDDVPSTRAMMKRGIVKAVVCQQPIEQGYRAFRAAFDMILAGVMDEDEKIIMENQIKITENL
ncbi:MAG: LacI family DNA-binding transcriptional regulator [Clostridia bacterium]